MTLLNPTISNSIVGYYGKPRLYDLTTAKIMEIKPQQPGSFIFTVKVVVETFTGPHNPPYGRDTITIKVDASSASSVGFEHKKM